MAAENELQVYGDDVAAADAAANAAIAEVKRIEAKYSRYLDDSVVSRINAAAAGPPVRVDEETLGLLMFADACFRQSGGLFDATSGVLRRAWNFKEPRVPSQSELDALLPLVGWDAVEISNAHVRLPRAGMQLDFGGFGKEYAVDRAARVMRDLGVASAMVNLAGDLAILGPQPGGAPWRVGIKHPRHDDKLLATLPVTSGALATSGDYERFIEVDGVRHCHILDPRTGRSARGLQAVTVHGPSCLVAGSATTIAMLKGREAGLAWLQELGLAHLAVADDATVIERF
jgi:thiamine biosynthesis lipoprotein